MADVKVSLTLDDPKANAPIRELSARDPIKLSVSWEIRFARVERDLGVGGQQYYVRPIVEGNSLREVYPKSLLEKANFEQMPEEGGTITGSIAPKSYPRSKFLELAPEIGTGEPAEGDTLPDMGDQNPPPPGPHVPSPDVADPGTFYASSPVQATVTVGSTGPVVTPETKGKSAFKGVAIPPYS